MVMVSFFAAVQPRGPVKRASVRDIDGTLEVNRRNVETADVTFFGCSQGAENEIQ
jgi:hypothetical protein